jgi:predicted nuclease of predicted toxin-antitoxin system
MKLLFDQNLSFKLCRRLGDLFPDSNQVRLLGLDRATDAAIWDYAKANDFVLVTLDADYADTAALRGPPSKVIWLRCGNRPTAYVEQLLRRNYVAIEQFARDTTSGCLEIY